MFSLSERCSVDDHRVSDSKVLIERMQIRFDGRAMSFECGRRAEILKLLKIAHPDWILRWSVMFCIGVSVMS